MFVFVERYQHRKFRVTTAIIVSIEAAVNLIAKVKAAAAAAAESRLTLT